MVHPQPIAAVPLPQPIYLASEGTSDQEYKEIDNRPCYRGRQHVSHSTPGMHPAVLYTFEHTNTLVE